MPTNTKKDDEGKWKSIAFVILFAVAFVATVTVYIFKRRAAAKLIHERNVLLEEKKQNEADIQIEKDTAKTKELLESIHGAEEKIKKIDKKLSDIKKAKDAVEAGLQEVDSWDDLNIL